MKKKLVKDSLFKNPNWENNLKVFHFQKEVSNVFDDMVTRSVPYYHETQLLIKNAALLTANNLNSVIKKNPVILDLGCSTGTTLLAIKNEFTFQKEKKLSKALKKNQGQNIKAIGIDSSPFMLTKAKEKMAALSQNHNASPAKPNEKNSAHLSVVFIEDDITNFNAHIKKNEQAIFFSLCYTLQFLPPHKRLSLLKKIFNSLPKGGRLILCEKVIEESSLLTAEAEEVYYNFKRQNHYSESEIARKRKSLEKTLQPNTVKTNLQRLKNSGFKHVGILHKWYNFAVFCAVK